MYIMLADIAHNIHNLLSSLVDRLVINNTITAWTRLFGPGGSAVHLPRHVVIQILAVVDCQARSCNGQNTERDDCIPHVPRIID